LDVPSISWLVRSINRWSGIDGGIGPAGGAV